MKKRLLTVGDSFTFGEELDNQYDAWPYRLAEQINYDVVNLGEPGSSNTGIIRRTITELTAERYDLVVIGWTSAGRIEWKDATGVEYNLWPGYSGRTFIKDHPWRLDLLEYINQYHDPAYLYQQYLLNVIMMQGYLQSQGIDYVMLNIVNNEYYRNTHIETFGHLANAVDKEKFMGWNEYGMAELTNGCKRGPGGHFLAEGHMKVADQLNSYTRTLGYIK